MTNVHTVVWGPPGRRMTATMPGRNAAYSNRQALFVARHGLRGDGAPASAVGYIGDDLGQFRIRPGRVDPIHPRAEFILGQPALHERGIKSTDYLLAVGAGRTEATTGLARASAISSPSPAIAAPPHQRDAGKPNAPVIRWPSPQSQAS